MLRVLTWNTSNREEKLLETSSTSEETLSTTFFEFWTSDINSWTSTESLITKSEFPP